MFLFDENNEVSTHLMVAADADALILVQVMEELRSTKKALKKAIDDIPDYTGKYSPDDYIANEQNDYNIAVNAFGEALRDFIWKTSPKSR